MAASPLPQAPDGTIAAPLVVERSAARALLRSGSCWWAAALLVAAVAFLVIGVPTAVVPNPVFGRSVATRWWDVVILATSSLLLGMVWATRTPRPISTASTATGPDDAGALLDEGEREGRRRSVVAGALTFLAVGCPTCNKLVLVALGTSGALSWFAPIQPVLGIAGIGVLAVTLRRRLRTAGAQSCAA